MKKDPNKACDKPGHLGWAILHDALAHPFMALTGFSRLGVRFHDWTSHKAWPRRQRAAREYVMESYNLTAVESFKHFLNLQGIATVVTSAPGEPYKLEKLS